MAAYKDLMLLISIVVALAWVVPVSQAFGPQKSPKVFFNRTFTEVSPIFGIRLDFNGSANCKSTDSYGSNDCEIPANSTAGLYWNLSVAKNLTNDVMGKMTLKVDGFSTLSVECPVCGNTCNFTILAIPVHIELPKCPLMQGHTVGHWMLKFPDIKYFPESFLDGFISILDAGNNTLLNIAVSLRVSTTDNIDELL
eukprot:m.338247 g.338247  ORF g.338247 m.338247 type:complete len:196 (+) comp18352_c0_seq1:163-750(+)